MSESRSASPRGRRLRRVALWVWLIALAASYVAWWSDAEPRPLRPGKQVLELAAVDGEERGEDIQLAYFDSGAGVDALARDDSGPPLVLLHGSPGSSGDFDLLREALPAERRVIVPDMPGFGDSQRDIPDYSAEAHSIYVEELLEELGVEHAHLFAFSMGGAVALELAARSPERVASISMVSAIGVEELELFGSHRFNHLLHGLQLTAIQVARHTLPHFGGADEWMLGVPYARNFYDTDQSRLRGHLERLSGPLLVVHGVEDFLVPIEAAREHVRIVPQSETVELDASHFLVWSRTEEVARLVSDFATRVEQGQVRVRSEALAERVQAAHLPFDPASIPPASGPLLLILVALLIVGTFVSEDLTTIAAGLLVAQGRLGFGAALFGCAAGIFIGDIGLFLAGRWLGRPVLKHAPFSWVLSEASLERASRWFGQRGAKAIFLSRFLPGLRLPTYFAAGVLRTSFLSFAFYFAVAVLIWTPILLGFSAWAGEEASVFFEAWGAWALILLLVAILFAERVLLRLLTWRGRRSLVGSWRRWTSWEFWPPWLFYPPVLVYVAWLALKHRGLAVVTAVNPAIPTGGFIGESKTQILDGLTAQGEWIARYELLRVSLPVEERMRRVESFLATLDDPFPIVLKPDVGQRGSGVEIVRDAQRLEQLVAGIEVDHMIQEYVAGPEYGVFYLHRPGAARGEIFSITEKRLPRLQGDGVHTIEELILRDPRHVIVAPTYLRLHAERLSEVLPVAEELCLVDLGTHCGGAVFENGARLMSPELGARFEELSASFEGFHFGRYDLRAASPEAFSAGREFRLIELNGLTSEATHIYDAETPLFEAYRTLFEQWRVAFEIGVANRAAGATPASLGELAREFVRYRRLQRSHGA